jgi:membrane fusion protein, multidrug efflux system
MPTEKNDTPAGADWNLAPGTDIGQRVRYVVAIVGLIVVIAALAGIKAGQIASLINMGKEAQKAGPPPETVATSVSQKQTWEGTLSAVGSVTAAKGVAVSNDAPGIVSHILFESGAVVREGQTLLELDSNVERAQLASARARLDLARVTADRSRALSATGSISKAQVDADESQLKTASTDLSALAAQIDRKTVRAPFSGRLGIRLVNLGQYLNAGTPITALEAIGTVYVDFTLPQQRLADVTLGMPVRVTIEGAEGSAGLDHLPAGAGAVPPPPSHEGAVSAVDPEIDSATRTIKLRASVPNKEESLRPGMFAKVSVVLPKQASFVTVPATALVHASYGDSIFVVEDAKDDAGSVAKGPDGKPKKVARQQFVRVGDARGDFVAILDGVTEGQEVASAGAFKLRNGSSVVVNNDVKLSPQLAPHPENR